MNSNDKSKVEDLISQIKAVWYSGGNHNQTITSDMIIEAILCDLDCIKRDAKIGSMLKVLLEDEKS